MLITTQRKAKSLVVDSLFKPVNGRTLTTERFDAGRYRQTPTEMVNQKVTVPTIKGVHAVYGIRKSDEHGPYTQLWCVCEPEQKRELR